MVVEITLVTQTDCHLCQQAADVLARLVADYPIRVTTVDLASAEGQRLAHDGGVWFPPGVFIDGEPFSYGRVSQRKLRRELDRRLHTKADRAEPTTP